MPTSASCLEVPVLESLLTVADRGPHSITVAWTGFDPEKIRNLKGYLLEYSKGGTSNWIAHDSVIPIKGKGSGQLYREKVDGLTADTPYFFRLKVVHKTGKQGLPGPALKARTTCGSQLT